MKILSAEEIRLWDQFTIRNEPVSSIDLMERAAAQCVDWMEEHYPDSEYYHVFCGKGNNGGDGLAIARMLASKNNHVTVSILEFGHKGTDDFQVNLARLHQVPEVDLRFIQSAEHFPVLEKNSIIIDALFGSGLNRGLKGVTAELVNHLNDAGATIISIDIPSGLFVDRSSRGQVTVKATHTLSFQCYKPAFLFAENEEALGDIHILDIGLHPGFCKELTNRFEWLDAEMIRTIYRPRKRFSHKGNFGHALLVAGSYGKIGASVLAGTACLRSGAGLLTIHIPGCGYAIVQTAIPEAMVLTDFNSSFSTKIENDLTAFDAIGIGPGLGTANETKRLLRELFDNYRNPLIIDADALNMMAAQKDLLKLVPAGSVLTPHPKEFERLFGETPNEFDRIELSLARARELNCIIVLKGHHSFIATPDGKGFFNSTGNAGMATAGSGDVLTGILTGLLAQGYSSVETALLGAYLHGVAGDKAAETESMESMIAGDIIKQLGAAFRTILNNGNPPLSM